MCLRDCLAGCFFYKALCFNLADCLIVLQDKPDVKLCLTTCLTSLCGWSHFNGNLDQTHSNVLYKTEFPALECGS